MLYPFQEKFLNGQNDRSILAYETGCLHPDTEIADVFSGETHTVRQWCELGKGFYVTAYDTSAKRFVFAKANRPVPFYVSRFYRFQLQGGASISVTPKHRFLVSESHGGIWKTAEELARSYALLQGLTPSEHVFLQHHTSSSCHPLSIVGNNLSLLPLSVQRLMNRVLDYLYRCSNHCHQCGRQLHEEAGICPSASPSQDGAHALYFYDSCTGGQERISNDTKYSCSSSRLLNHLSKNSSSHHCDKRQVFDQQHQVFLGCTRLYENLLRTYHLFSCKIVQIRIKISTALHRVLYSLMYSTRDVGIVKVDTLETLDVYYDFHVPKYENYVLSGVINHNTGKNYVAELWLEQKDRKRNAVVICPKQVRKRWKEKTPFATVYSFEDFKKCDPPENPSAVIIDEADCVASPLFVAKLRSKRTEKVYEYLMKNEPDILLLTATPVRSSPWNMHTLLVLAKLVPPESWKEYRAKYFSLENKPFLPRPAWMPKNEWRREMQALIDRYTHTALMSDIVDLPDETHDVIELEPPMYDKNDEWEPMAQFVADHRLEQLSKLDEILKISRGYRKILVVARYTEQIDTFAAKLKDRPVYVLDGRTRDQEATIRDAEADPECCLIMQSSVSAGFELPSFSLMIYASMDFSVRNYIQSKGRIKRINALKPVRYVYMLGGRCDRAVYDNVMAGRDFVPAHYLHVRATQEV